MTHSPPRARPQGTCTARGCRAPVPSPDERTHRRPSTTCCAGSGGTSPTSASSACARGASQARAQRARLGACMSDEISDEERELLGPCSWRIRCCSPPALAERAKSSLMGGAEVASLPTAQYIYRIEIPVQHACQTAAYCRSTSNYAHHSARSGNLQLQRRSGRVCITHEKAARLHLSSFLMSRAHAAKRKRSGAHDEYGPHDAPLPLRASVLASVSNAGDCALSARISASSRRASPTGRMVDTMRRTSASDVYSARSLSTSLVIGPFCSPLTCMKDAGTRGSNTADLSASCTQV
eukprot:CAMPEP_0119401128 /NCGR_PEP_ID=MMETSP1334-20130426/142214_1 /TAXON_ID=127549 /ORGANISM="Calcidiscus leptoporus, Strain RCC1130" /LENGTH=294 /DNA_ID=CAMNT_0007425037 /DNA_START=708 /DNA_END=1594 /DNA_ORIENTATION=-